MRRNFPMTRRVLILILLLSIVHIRIDAMARSSESDQDSTSFSYYEAMDIKCEEEEPFGYIFSCYDVNEEGEILLTFNSLFTSRIQIYDKEMKYIKGYHFSMDSECISFWEDDGSICIYLKKYERAIKVDRNCELIEEYTVDDEGKKAIYSEVSKEKTINDKTYIAKGIFLSNNSVLEYKDENGVCVLLYSHKLYQLLHDVGLLAIVLFVIWRLFIRRIMKDMNLLEK